VSVGLVATGDGAADARRRLGRVGVLHRDVGICAQHGARVDVLAQFGDEGVFDDAAEVFVVQGHHHAQSALEPLAHVEGDGELVERAEHAAGPIFGFERVVDREQHSSAAQRGADQAVDPKWVLQAVGGRARAAASSAAARPRARPSLVAPLGHGERLSEPAGRAPVLSRA